MVERKKRPKVALHMLKLNMGFPMEWNTLSATRNPGIRPFS
jgi:hypothetical protein